jgi:hypothetical protein
MLPEPLNKRFQMLQSRLVDAAYIKDYCGLDDLAGKPDLVADLAAVRASLPNPTPEQPGKIDRVVLEALFTTKHVLPKKWAAARLGMKEPLFDVVFNKRTSLQIPMRKPYLEYDCLIDESFFNDLNGAIPAFRFVTFSDQENYCERLHDALKTALNVTDQQLSDGKLWCATDRAMSTVGLGDYPRRYGYYFDCITCEPLSTAHATWLDFKKPLFLSPDRCSKLLYAKYEGDISPWKSGTRSPDDLDTYKEAVEKGAL